MADSDERQASTSRRNDASTEKSDFKEDEESNLVKFTCSVCGLSENCRYGSVKVAGRTHTYRYQDEVYYMLDPFRDRSKINERRLAPAKSSSGGSKVSGGSRATSILDIFVLGALCSICGQPVCIDELCSIFYTKTFCVTCVTREKAHFPKEVVKQIETARKQREKREAERKEVGLSI